MSPRVTVLISIAIGGAIGATVRAALTESVAIEEEPWVTLVVNIVGTIMLVALASLIAWRPSLPHWLNPLVGVGICGSLTTFSTMQLQVVEAMRDGLSGRAVLYLVSSIVFGMAAVIVARVVARRVLT